MEGVGSGGEGEVRSLLPREWRGAVFVLLLLLLSRPHLKWATARSGEVRSGEVRRVSRVPARCVCNAVY